MEDQCLACGVKVEFPDNAAGKTYACPHCDAPLTVPGALAKGIAVQSPRRCCLATTSLFLGMAAVFSYLVIIPAAPRDDFFFISWIRLTGLAAIVSGVTALATVLRWPAEFKGGGAAFVGAFLGGLSLLMTCIAGFLARPHIMP